jgi:hypothetical protein
VSGWAGGCALFELAELEDDSAGPPSPGVTGPPGRAVGAWGMGASGTCCCAAIPEVRTTPVPRNAANAIALERNFTAISSSLKRLSRLQKPGGKHRKTAPHRVSDAPVTRRLPELCVLQRFRYVWRLNSLQKNAERSEEKLRRRPSGDKALAFFLQLAARLKSCPDTWCFSRGFFSRLSSRR